MMRSPAFPPRRPSHLVRYIVPSAVLICLLYYLAHTGTRETAPLVSPVGGSGATSHDVPQPPYTPAQDDKPIEPVVNKPTEQAVDKPTEQVVDKPTEQVVNEIPLEDPHAHPIDTLIKLADSDFTEILAKEAHSLEEAAAAYRKRRGRHPPPGFREWYQFAKEHKAVMVEDFWDQIYHDLGPFWGLDPKIMRKESWEFEMTINVRNRNASAESGWFWTKIWLEMIKTIETYLPDMDIALNAMDEPRLVVPWEDIRDRMATEKKTRYLWPPNQVVTEFDTLPNPKKGYSSPPTRKKTWESDEHYWPIARRGCPPDSLARTVAIQNKFDKTPTFTPSYAAPHQYRGFVSNWTMATEFCHQPDLQGLEGIFIHPLSTSANDVLFPMFGGSKLATNNEILLPAPMYWNDEARFTGGGFLGLPWDKKQHDLIWRGVATGGHNTAENWKGFQRHRFVAMNNATKLTRAESGEEPPVNFVLPSGDNAVAAQKDGKLGQWVKKFADVGVTDLACDEKLDEKLKQKLKCVYTDAHYTPIEGRPLAEQFNYKYLPDIDGNSFSGRYLGFLRSTALPIKSTMWKEWHDSRLVAWKHFVPMDNRFLDYYGIMEYFLGYEDKIAPHDAQAKKIATDGKEWAEKVLRKEDMQIYVFRLLLEYARVSDERREKMGWVEDLV